MLDLIKALGTLNPSPNPSETAEKDVQQNAPSATAPAPTANETPNVMASVLSRHEEISNRIKNKRSV